MEFKPNINLCMHNISIQWIWH